MKLAKKITIWICSIVYLSLIVFNGYSYASCTKLSDPCDKPGINVQSSCPDCNLDEKTSDNIFSDCANCHKLMPFELDQISNNLLQNLLIPEKLSGIYTSFVYINQFDESLDNSVSQESSILQNFNLGLLRTVILLN